MSGSSAAVDAAGWAAEALARVLDLPAGELRDDSPLADLGADSVARIQWADMVEQLAAEAGTDLHVEDDAITEARTLGDLSAHVAARAGAGR